MRYLALATDFDGTLAHDGVVEEATLEALKNLRDSGRKLVMVTGRQLPDLMATFSGLAYFDLVVAENGGLLYTPETKQEKVLCEPPSTRLVQALERRGVDPLAIGKMIVATWDSQKQKVLDAIHEEGLECQIIFNKGALMVLPPGVNKATGLKSGIDGLGLSLHNVVGVGDAENDHAFLRACEAAVAVANALPALKEAADWVTEGARGDGVRELIERLIEDDLAKLVPRLGRHDILLGRQDDREVKVPAYGSSLMVAGTSGGGKSTLTTGFMERSSQCGYQMCAIDPEGDYETFPGAVVLGDSKRAPTVQEILAVLETPGQNVIVSLVGVTLEHRPEFFQRLLPELMQLRARTGRPHWVVVDEAHHVLPSERSQAEIVVPKQFTNFMLITLKPAHVDKAAVAAVDTIVAVGEAPGETICEFATACGENAPEVPEGPLEKGLALLWSRKAGGEPVRFKVAESSVVSVRHSRKYATAELTPDRSFYFKGPEGKLNLRAQNLMIFTQTMDGVDDETWLFHFRRGEYSKWFREAIKSDDLADAAAGIERQAEVSAEESRKQIREQIEQRFTLPA